MEGFYRQEEGGTRKLKEWIISGMVTLLEAGGFIRQITSLALTRKIKTYRVKITFLGEAETAVRLGIKSWWGL